MTLFKSSVLILAAAVATFTLVSCGKKEPEKAAAPAVQMQAPKKAATPVVEDKEEGSLVAKIPTKADASDEEAKVESDDSNVSIDAEATSIAVETGRPTRGNWLAISKIPPNSLASKVTATPGLHWRPVWRFKGVGGSWLAGVELSSDGTLLAFVETTGKDDGPYGSRIVLYSTNQWRALKTFELDRKITLFCFIPGKLEILAFCERQPELKQASILMKVDLNTGSVIQTGAPLKERIVSLVCPSPSTAFATMAGESSILVYNPDKLNESIKGIPCSNKGGYLAISANRESLASIGTGKMEIFKIAGRELNSIMSSPLPDGMPEAGNLVFTENPTVFAVAPPQGANTKGDAFLIRNGSAWRMAENASGLVAYDPKTKKILAGAKAKSSVSVYKMPEFDPEGEFSPPESQPRTSGTPVKIFYMSVPDAMGVLESTGAFYMVKRSIKGRRWYKVLVFMPLK